MLKTHGPDKDIFQEKLSVNPLRLMISCLLSRHNKLQKAVIEYE